MLKIGIFSKLTRVSIRMLRHYDEIGLLRPAATDPVTGYRYYREDQLPAACRIAAYREMGFGLAAIRELMDLPGDPARLEGQLLAQRRALADEAARTAYRIQLLDTALERLRNGDGMNYDVILRTLPRRTAACIRMTIPRYEQEGLLWKILTEETAPLGLVPDAPCLCGAIFHDEEWKEANVDVEIQKTVVGTYPDTSHVRFCTLEPLTVACAAYRGGYGRIGEVYAAVYRWAAANGYEPDGPMMNLYHVGPHETADPDQFVTEVCCPVRRAGTADT